MSKLGVRSTIGDRLPIEYGQVVIQGPTAKRLWPSVITGLIFFLGLLLEDNWVTALVMGLVATLFYLGVGYLLDRAGR